MTICELRQILNYNPETGAWSWRVRRGGRALAGSPAGWVEKSTGYLRIRIAGRTEYAHRLAFLYMEGSLPPNDVDHIDGNHENCIWANLRHATTSQNLANKSVQSNSKSGIKGVRFRYGIWEARLTANGRQVHRSTHQTMEDAARAYASAATTHHGEFARVS